MHDSDLIIVDPILSNLDRLWCEKSEIKFLQDGLKLTAVDQPIHAIVVLSFLTGVVLITISPFLPASFGSSPQSPHRDRNLLLEEAAASSFVDDNSKACQTFRPLLAGAVASLALRIELFRRILGATECTTSSIEV